MAAGRHGNPRHGFSHRHRSGDYEIETGYSRDQYAGQRSNDYSNARSRISNMAGRDDRVRKSEEVKEMPPAKKSKFSPVTWDKESVSSRDDTSKLNGKLRQNGDVNINSVSLDVNDVCDVVDATDKLQDVECFPKTDMEFRSAESAVTESPTLLSLLPSKERRVNEVDAKDVVVVEDEMQVDDVVHTSSLHISKSRWASDDDDSPVNKESRKVYSVDMHSSPECGEFIRDDSEGEKSSSTPNDDILDGSGDVIEEENCDVQGDKDNNSQSEYEEKEITEVPMNAIWEGCKSVFDYERLNKINEGTYGVVYRARHKFTGEIVALKKVKLEGEREGFPITALREIKFLMSVDHPSIVRGKEIVMGDLDSVFVVMEYMEHDLKALMEVMKHPFSISEVKCLMLQLLEGIQHLHDNWVIHRDLKSSNILFNNQGELKICDFGMARQYANPLKPYTALVVTLWYRAPEILFGAKQYSEAVDMWSVGCIMAELLSKEPLFQGKTEVDQMDKILKLLGTPNETIWPGFSELPEAKKAKFVKQPYNLLRKKFPVTSFTGAPALSDAGFDLLNRMLTYDPVKRITVHEALNHHWFQEVPMAKAKEFMPTYPAQNAKDRTWKHAPRK